MSRDRRKIRNFEWNIQNIYKLTLSYYCYCWYLCAARKYTEHVWRVLPIQESVCKLEYIGHNRYLEIYPSQQINVWLAKDVSIPITSDLLILKYMNVCICKPLCVKLCKMIYIFIVFDLSAYTCSKEDLPVL